MGTGQASTGAAVGFVQGASGLGLNEGIDKMLGRPNKADHPWKKSLSAQKAASDRRKTQARDVLLNRLKDFKQPPEK